LQPKCNNLKQSEPTGNKSTHTALSYYIVNTFVRRLASRWFSCKLRTATKTKNAIKK